MDNLELSKLKLLEQIKSEKQRLSQLIEKEDEELKFLSTIWESPELDFIKLVAQTDPTDMITAIVLADEHRRENIQYIQEIISKNRTLYETTDSRKIRSLLSTLADLKEYDLYDVLKTNTSPPTKNISHATTFALGMKLIFRLTGIKNIDIHSFMQAIDTLPAYIDALLCISTAKDIMQTKSREAEKIEKESQRIIEKLGLSNGDIKRKFDLNDTKRIIYNARSYYDKLKQNSNSEKRAYRRELAVYETLNENVNKILSTGEIKNIKDLLFRISNPKVRFELLKMIYFHNQEIYESLIEEYQSLSFEPSSKYQSLLDRYGILPNTYQVASVMNNSLTDVEEMLRHIVSLGITIPNEILSIIQRSTLTVIKFLTIQVSRGFIDPELLKNNMNVFFENSSEHTNLIENLAYFKENGLNPQYLKSNQELFLLPNENLKRNFNVLTDYNLLSSMKSGINCSFLSSQSLESGIDTILELGYEEFLVQNLSLLNYQSRFKRLIVLKELNIPVTSIEELESVLTTDKFLITDEDIDAYIYNAAPYCCPTVELSIQSEQGKDISTEFFDSFSSTERTYNIGDIIISKNRVHRNLITVANPTNRNSLMYAIIHNAILSDEEYEKIQTTIPTGASVLSKKYTDK